jgi:uncharacterized protein (TIGR02145 family)
MGRVKYIKLVYALAFLWSGCLIISCGDDAGFPVPDDIVFGSIPPTEAEIAAIPVVDTVELYSDRAILPASYALNMPPVSDQGAEGSCSAFASAYAARSFHLYDDLDGEGSYALDELFSPEYTYNIVKMSQAQAIRNDCQAGSKLPYNLQVMKASGAAPWSELPYSSGNGCSADIITDEIRQAAACYKIDDFYRLPSINPILIKSLLYNGYPLIFSVQMDWDFTLWNVRPDYMHGPDYTWKVQGSIAGAGKHAMVICGWDDGRHAWKIMNSWGTAWGVQGFGWIDYDFLGTVITMIPKGGILDSDAYNMYVISTSKPDPACSCEEAGGDADEDGICADVDCDDEDPLNTDVDEDGDGACAMDDCDDSDAEVYIGAACDDGNPETVNDVIDEICLCTGETVSDTTVADIDGNVYPTVVIGSQVWMAQNLRTTRYRNGDDIPNEPDVETWTNLTSGAWVHYNNNAQFEMPYGKLYNWYAVTDNRRVCPAGWRTPDISDWTVLVDYLGGAGVAGGKLKEAGLEHWTAPNTGATNSSGFTALPGGFHYVNGSINMGSYAAFWTSEEYDANNGSSRDMYSTQDTVLSNGFFKADGLSVRCVKE